jgi:putative tricarboxylic transport membrane protein
MIEAFLQGLANVVSPEVFFVIAISSFIGIVLGIIPAISGGLLCVLLLPFLFGRDPMLIMPILCALIAISGMGGSITAVLIGVPGDVSNSATVMDGFSMTRKGQGGRAVGLALASNVAGGILSVVLAFAMIPIIIPLIIAFKSPEMFLTMVLALCFLGVLTQGSRIKGLISAGLGVLLACIGFQNSTGVARFTFGDLYLYEGIDIVPFLIALFATPILVELSASGESISPPELSGAGKLSELLKGARELFSRHFWLWFRSTVLGYIVGIMPAIGRGTAVWTAYGQAKRTSKEPEKFGKGAAEGIVAPESANSATTAGDLLTTLAFGIPGSPVMVVLLAAFLLMGVQPGPKLMVEHTALAFTMLISVAAATLISGIICFFASPFLIKVTRISPAYLFAIIIPILCVGAFISRGYMTDLFFLAIISLLGIFVSKLGYSAPALVLGFILGSLLERYLWLSIDGYGLLFFTSPLSIILVILIIGILAYEPLSKLFKRGAKQNAGGSQWEG